MTTHHHVKMENMGNIGNMDNKRNKNEDKVMTLKSFNLTDFLGYLDAIIIMILPL